MINHGVPMSEIALMLHIFSKQTSFWDGLTVYFTIKATQPGSQNKSVESYSDGPPSVAPWDAQTSTSWLRSSSTCNEGRYHWLTMTCYFYLTYSFSSCFRLSLWRQTENKTSESESCALVKHWFKLIWHKTPSSLIVASSEISLQSCTIISTAAALRSQ